MKFWKKKQTATEKAFQERLLKLDESIRNMKEILTNMESRPEPKSPFHSDSSIIKKKQAELGNTLSVLQNELSFIKHHLLHHKEDSPPSSSGHIPVIYIQSLHIENVDMKEVDLSNNLGQLGIKDLPGQLNIGTVYGKTKPEETEEPEDEKKKDHKDNPTIFIQRKKD